MIIWGWRIYFRTIGQGVFFCRKCGTDRNYRHRRGRGFVHIFWIPLIPLPKTAEHVQCMSCKTRYVTDVLQAPTAAQQGFAAQPQPGFAPQPAPAPQSDPAPQQGTGTQPGSTPWWA